MFVAERNEDIGAFEIAGNRERAALKVSEYHSADEGVQEVDGGEDVAWQGQRTSPVVTTPTGLVLRIFFVFDVGAGGGSKST